MSKEGEMPDQAKESCWREIFSDSNGRLSSVRIMGMIAI